MDKLIFKILLCFTSVVTTCLGQTEKDNSKPTNVYSQIDNYLEYTQTSNGNLMGYHPKINFAPNEDHLLLVEIPFLYNDKTQKFGLRDLRAKYFYVPYRDYSKRIGALGLAFDSYLPFGNVANGLGTGSWVISPGILVGVMGNKATTLSFFPSVSYVYRSKSYDPNLGAQLDAHGVNFQVLTSYKFNDKGFVLFTPIFESLDTSGVFDNQTKFEFEFVHDLLEGDYQFGAMVRTSLQENAHIFRLNFTVFL